MHTTQEPAPPANSTMHAATGWLLCSTPVAQYTMPHPHLSISSVATRIH